MLGLKVSSHGRVSMLIWSQGWVPGSGIEVLYQGLLTRLLTMVELSLKVWFQGYVPKVGLKSEFQGWVTKFGHKTESNHWD